MAVILAQPYGIFIAPDRMAPVTDSVIPISLSNGSGVSPSLSHQFSIFLLSPVPVRLASCTCSFKSFSPYSVSKVLPKNLF